MTNVSDNYNLALGICGRDSKLTTKYGDAVESLTIEGYKVMCGFFPAKFPNFDSTGKHSRSVLLRNRAFSCNYRDKAIILRMANMPLNKSFYPIGSEFCATVMEVGKDVRDLNVGDRVMINSYYASGERPWGIPTNHASRLVQIIPSSKLMKVPDAMTDEEAASFSIGGQTSFSMVRRTEITRGTKVLVTGGSSNTSLFLMASARRAGGDVYATTTSSHKIDALIKAGSNRVYVVDPEHGGIQYNEEIIDFCRDSGGFDVVLDPFADLYLAQAVHVMAVWGRYISCGVERQFPPAGSGLSLSSDQPLLDADGFFAVMTKNLNIIGNCIGSTEDLENALDAWSNGELPVAIDSVFSSEDAAGNGELICRGAAEFLSRTYLDSDRIGKVVYRYM
jgi:NADPH:quinone reductase-like Zn-dependent oxidoreductase